MTAHSVPTSPVGILVDDTGLTLPVGLTTPFDVYFDDQHVWSFAPHERRARDDGLRRIGWPRAMRAWLDGVTTVSLRAGDEVAFESEVQFGSASERISFVDRFGIPVMIDKWGLIQRPFAARGAAVVEEMLDVTERIITVLAEDCDVHCWLAFGSLLGAAREGGVIAHDSDVDLAYLSEATTPHQMNLEMFELARALRRRGLKVMNKSGSFITVLFTAPDGAQGSVDVYTCFYLGHELYETATVRAPVPREAVLPLGTMSFEGRELPVPADPDALLRASYGPGWRTPDPSFRHQPGPEVTEPFADWFGTLMTNRRDWERGLRNVPDSALERPSDFAEEVALLIPHDAHVLDVGAGTGADALYFARSGFGAAGLDYARGAFGRAFRLRREQRLNVMLGSCNLYDLRDVLTMTALLARRADGPRVLYARGLLESLAPKGRANLLMLAQMFLRTGDQVFLEVAVGRPGRYDPQQGGRRYRLDLAKVAREWEELGVVVESLTEVEPNRYRLQGVRRGGAG